MTFLPANLYHSGYLVADIDEAIDRVSRSGISRFTAPKEQELRLVRGDGSHDTCRLSYVYSVDGPHHVELIQPIDSRVLELDGAMSFHHLGFWVDDLEADMKRAVEAGLGLDFYYLLEDGSPKVAYHEDSVGMRYELVPSSHRPVLEGRWAAIRGESS